MEWFYPLQVALQRLLVFRQVGFELRGGRMLGNGQLRGRVLVVKADGNMCRIKEGPVHSFISGLEICDDD